MKPSANVIAILIPIALPCLAGKTMADEAVLRPGDQIQLMVKGVPDEEKTDLNGNYTISDAGTIPLPYISDPVAAGQKPSVLAHLIEAAYKEAQIYTNPTVVINFGDERNVRRISITGGVNRDGPIEYYDGMSLLDAVSAAGGLSDFAKQKDVKIIRGETSSQHDLDAIVRDSRLNVKLLPGDTIIIPETGRKL